MNERQVNLYFYMMITFPVIRTGATSWTAGRLWGQLPGECRLDEATFINDLITFRAWELITFDGAYLIIQGRL